MSTGAGFSVVPRPVFAHGFFFCEHGLRLPEALRDPAQRRRRRDLGACELLLLVTAFRLFLPDAGLVLSTREPSALRDGLFPVGISHASAGNHTEPGGYTGAGRDNIHQTVRGRIVELAANASEWSPQSGWATTATGQIDIADERSAVWATSRCGRAARRCSTPDRGRLLWPGAKHLGVSVREA